MPSCTVAGGTHTGDNCVEGDAYDLVMIVGTHENKCCTRTAKPAVNGVCNNTVRNGCVTGTPEVQPSSGGYDRWYCNGSNGGTNATDCQIEQPTISVNGQCNNGIINGCLAGTFADKDDSNTAHIWDCNGINGGTNATNCQRAFAANGVCDNNTKFTCLTGTPVSRVETATYYQWGCNGISGGTSTTSDACRKDKSINGSCDNSTKNGCLTGTSANTGTNTAGDKWIWHCIGSNGGTNATDCEKNIPVNAVCGNTKDTCTSGELDSDSVTTTQDGTPQWVCKGMHDGNNETCTLDTSSKCNYPDTVTGYINSCKTGATHKSKQDNDTHYQWACVDDVSGQEELCQRLKFFYGECGLTKDTCKKGERGTVSQHTEDYLNSGYHILPELPGDAKTKSKELNDGNNYALSTLDYLWSCEGGLSKVYCRSVQSFAGECPVHDPEQGDVDTSDQHDFINYCKTGHMNNKRSDNTKYTWSCNGNGRFNSSSYRVQCTRPLDGAPPASLIKFQGECSNQRYQCRGGTVSNSKSPQIPVNYIQKSGNTVQIRTRNQTIYTWDCVGTVPSDTGSVAATQKCKHSSAMFNGECDTTNVDNCAGGVLYDLTDSDAHYRWMCFGQNAGSSADRNVNQRVGGHIVYCSKPKFTITDDADGDGLLDINPL